LLVLQRDVAQPAQPRIDAIRTLTTAHNALHDGLRIVDPGPGLIRQRQQCTMPGDSHDVLPPHAGVVYNHCFNLHAIHI